MIVGDILTNCYLFGEDNTVFIIDPGDEGIKIEEIIVKNKLKPIGIILTHGHFDHIGAALYLKKKFKLSIYAHIDEAKMLNDIHLNLSYYIGEELRIQPDEFLNEGDILRVGRFNIKVLHTPGHTEGSICLLCDNILFSGDTIFKESYGRCDLPLGNEKLILDSITKKILTLDDKTIIYPGHGMATNIKDEKQFYK